MIRPLCCQLMTHQILLLTEPICHLFRLIEHCCFYDFISLSGLLEGQVTAERLMKDRLFCRGNRDSSHSLSLVPRENHAYATVNTGLFCLFSLDLTELGARM